MCEIGTKFLYSTHGFTLLAAVIEKATGEKFDKVGFHLFIIISIQNTLTSSLEYRTYQNNSNIQIDVYHKAFGNFEQKCFR